MRFYRSADLAEVKAKMAAAGFRTPNDPEWIGSTEMARLLGLTNDQLRWREQAGKVPKPVRDHAGRRRWPRKKVEAFLRRQK